MRSRLAPISIALSACIVLHGWPALAADPTTADCLAASEASLKSGNEHKLRAERTQLLVCSTGSCPVDVRRECVRRVDEVNSSMPTIMLQAKDAAGNDLSNVRVSMDGEVLAERLEGTSISIDPGEHEFVFETAGQPPLKKKLLIQEAQKDRRESITFGVAVAPAPHAASPENTGAKPPIDAAPGPEVSSTHRTVGFAVGGVGVLFLGLAIYEQSTALSRASHSKDAAASSSAAVRATASPIHDQANRAQNYAIVSGLLGAAAVATGLYFVLSPARSRADATLNVLPQVGTSGGGMALQGTW